jgi:8-oxo-dGTP pyrophosphatase MutT (NUDIX family)
MRPLSPTRAGVLVPLLSIAGETHVVLIRRSPDAPTHGGDVAFPGGRHHPGHDESLLATALREAEEEIGVRPQDVELLRALPEVRTLTSNFLISPFIGRLPHPYPLRADTREVAALLILPLSELAAPSGRQTVRRRSHDGRELDVPAIVVGEHVIWGATRRIVDELLRVL